MYSCATTVIGPRLSMTRGAWRCLLLEDYTFPTPYMGREYANGIISIDAAGGMTIRRGYCWDGCTLTWDGWRVERLPTWPRMAFGAGDGYRVTDAASLKHDATTQFLDQLADVYNMTRWQAWYADADLFRGELLASGFGRALSDVYYYGVLSLGYVWKLAQGPPDNGRLDIDY